MRIFSKNSSAFRWIVSKSKFQALNIFCIVLLYSLLALLGIFTANVSKQVVDSAVGHQMSKLIYYGIVFAIILLLQIFIKIISRILIFKISTKIEIKIKLELFDNILNKDYAKITKYHSGELINRLTSDISVVTDAITTILPNLAFMAVKIVGVFYVLFLIDYRFALVFVIMYALFTLASRLFKSKMKKLHKDCQASDGKVRSFLQEIIESLIVVKAFGAENKAVSDATQLQQENYAMRRKKNIFSIFSSTGFSFVFSAGYIYGLVWGAFGIFNNTLTYGTLTQILSLVGQVQSPVSDLTSIMPKYYSALASAERIMEVANLPDEVEINDEKQINCSKIYKELKCISFKNITFKYDRDLVIDHSSLSINKGDFAVITGI
ncbi:MAG: ABC transporter ATP-binding protein, partial [Bacillota bacterium]|nr:ABC transporter ATP-binding protein [Bacillota bacterium]